MLLSGYFVVFLCFCCCSEVSLNYSGWLVLGEVRKVWFGRRVARRAQGWWWCRRWCFPWRIDEGLIPLEGKKLRVTASEGKDGMGIKKHSLLDLLRPSNLLLKDRRKKEFDQKFESKLLFAVTRMTSFSLLLIVTRFTNQKREKSHICGTEMNPRKCPSSSAETCQKHQMEI